MRYLNGQYSLKPINLQSKSVDLFYYDGNIEGYKVTFSCSISKSLGLTKIFETK